LPDCAVAVLVAVGGTLVGVHVSPEPGVAVNVGAGVGPMIRDSSFDKPLSARLAS
jgi:hypothetical protein